MSVPPRPSSAISRCGSTFEPSYWDLQFTCPWSADHFCWTEPFLRPNICWTELFLRPSTCHCKLRTCYKQSRAREGVPAPALDSAVSLWPGKQEKMTKPGVLSSGSVFSEPSLTGLQGSQPLRTDLSHSAYAPKVIGRAGRTETLREDNIGDNTPYLGKLTTVSTLVCLCSPYTS